MVGSPLGEEAGAPVPPCLDQARGHHQAVGREDLAEDVVDVLPALDEARPRHRGGGALHVEVEIEPVRHLEGQRLAVLPADHAVAIVDVRRPLHGLAEGGRMELVHRRVGLAVELLGRQAEVQHGDPAAERREVRLDVAREAAADGEDGVAGMQPEGGGNLRPELAVQLLGHVTPARAAVAALAPLGFGVVEHQARTRIRPLSYPLPSHVPALGRRATILDGSATAQSRSEI